MVKKKKTRAEKILADTRHFSFNIEPQAAQVSLPAPSAEHTLPNIPKVATVNYGYVISDLRRTVFITLVILIAQIILFFAMQKM